MTADEISQLLSQLAHGPFAEAVEILTAAVNDGAQIVEPSDLNSSAELRGSYALRVRRLEEMQKRMPGFAEVASLFSTLPDRSWLLVGIDGAGVGGVLVLSEQGEPFGCFAYEDVH